MKIALRQKSGSLSVSSTRLCSLCFLEVLPSFVFLQEGLGMIHRKKLSQVIKSDHFDALALIEDSNIKCPGFR